MRDLFDLADLYPGLAPDREAASFDRLKGRLAELWTELATREDEVAYTSVVVPSFSLDAAELRKVDGISFYEERLLFLLIRLRNPRARLVYVTSQPVHPLILEYYLQLLAGIPASHARSRLTLLCAHDASPRPLTEKLLERPRLVARIRAAIPDPARAYLTVFNATPLERTLSVVLDLPLYGVDPALAHLGTKSGSRRVFREAGVPLPEGREELFTERDVLDALAELRRRRPAATRALVKLNDSFSGEGNALVRFRPAADGGGEPTLDTITLASAGETKGTFLAKLGRMGGVVEEHLDGEDKRSPSAQLLVEPDGRIHVVSTHEQVLGGATGEIYLGCRFPADDAYRERLQDEGRKVAEVLRSKGVIGRFGVDFIVWRGPEGAFDLAAVEINLRKTGTTHPFMALQFLTGGSLEPATGRFVSTTGHPKHYRSTDNLVSESYRGLLPEDLVEILTANALQYGPDTETGVLFHMIGALSQYGKLGLTAIGNSAREAEELYAQTIAVLERESRRRPETRAPMP